jgi:CRISPR type III-associated protein (TIGR04423 family)
MKKNHQKITVNEIPDNLIVEGYYWYSYAQKPKIVSGQTIDKGIFKPLPFIIEGNFYAANENLSIQVKNIDGEYHIFKYDLNESAYIDLETKEYIAHDLEGVARYKMKEAWEAVEDELVEGMKVLKPTWSAFAGFVKSKKQ